MNIDKVYYYNRNNVLKLTLNEYPYYAGEAEFKDWQWGYDTQFGLFKNFHRAKDSFPFQVTIVSKDKSDRDYLCNIFSEDVLAGEPGYLMINDWKLPCYISEATHDFFGTTLDWQIEFKAVTETSTWTRETTTSYNGVDTAESSDLGRDYSMEEGDEESGRGYAEASSGESNELMDSFGELLVDSDGNVLIDSSGATGRVGYGYSIVSSYAKRISLPVDGNGYRVTFYGAVTNPVIYLNGNPVRVLTSVASGERLVVTSNGREKTIFKVSAQGVKTDYFVYRDKEHTPFFSIGKSTELTYGEVKFDFTTIKNRSEPSWN